MVSVAQLVEPRIVNPLVVGSIPILHPNIANKRRMPLWCDPGKPERLLALRMLSHLFGWLLERRISAGAQPEAVPQAVVKAVAGGAHQF